MSTIKILLSAVVFFLIQSTRLPQFNQAQGKSPRLHTHKIKCFILLPVLLASVFILFTSSCDKSTNQFSTSPPPEGPHFSVSPIPVEVIARITALGYNSKIIPIAHTYWFTCDNDHILQGSGPCNHGHFPIRAPGNGTVRDVNHANDGMIRIEGPPGLVWTFGHVTPEPGLDRGTSVEAGQTIARMYYAHGFDFGLVNYGIEHFYITPSRYPDPSRHGQHPIEQYPEPLRSELVSRVISLSENRLGKLSQDIPGTASGAWFIEGSPMDNTPLEFEQEWRTLWMGRYTENDESRTMSVGERWEGMPNTRNLVVDDAHPSWEEITPDNGRLAIRLWSMGVNARANPDFPAGTALIEMTSEDRLMIEWFPTHEPVSDFTDAARVYER